MQAVLMPPSGLPTIWIWHSAATSGAAVAACNATAAAFAETSGVAAGAAAAAAAPEGAVSAACRLGAHVSSSRIPKLPCREYLQGFHRENTTQVQQQHISSMPSTAHEHFGPLQLLLDPQHSNSSCQTSMPEAWARRHQWSLPHYIEQLIFALRQAKPRGATFRIMRLNS
jgi:hypothetical protein